MLHGELFPHCKVSLSLRAFMDTWENPPQFNLQKPFLSIYTKIPFIVYKHDSTLTTRDLTNCLMKTVT